MKEELIAKLRGMSRIDISELGIELKGFTWTIIAIVPMYGSVYVRDINEETWHIDHLTEESISKLHEHFCPNIMDDLFSDFL